MNRRKFLKSVFGGVAVATLSSISWVERVFPRKLSNKEKEAIIAKALDTTEGREALAQSMVEPIRNSLRRKLLFVDEIPVVPQFEIAANPQVRLSEIKARRFHIVDRTKPL